MELLKNDVIDKELSGLSKGWTIINYTKIQKEFYFNDFKEALNFSNEVG